MDSCGLNYEKEIRKNQTAWKYSSGLIKGVSKQVIGKCVQVKVMALEMLTRNRPVLSIRLLNSSLLSGPLDKCYGITLQS